jgi:hypothetical protein
MSKHTPGPWTYDSGIIPPDGPGRYSTVSTYDGDTDIAEVNDLIAQGSANAKLIAAAPDLLEALKRCKFDSLNMSLDDLAFCRAAIQKAEGSKP